MSIRGKVAVIGVGLIPFGELFHKGLETMIQEAFMSCIKSVDKGIDPKEIKAAWFGQWSGGVVLLRGGVITGHWLGCDLLPDVPPFISRVRSGYAPSWGGLQTQPV